MPLSLFAMRDTISLSDCHYLQCPINNLIIIFVILPAHIKY